MMCLDTNASSVDILFGLCLGDLIRFRYQFFAKQVNSGVRFTLNYKLYCMFAKKVNGEATYSKYSLLGIYESFSSDMPMFYFFSAGFLSKRHSVAY